MPNREFNRIEFQELVISEYPLKEGYASPKDLAKELKREEIKFGLKKPPTDSSYQGPLIHRILDRMIDSGLIQKNTQEDNDSKSGSYELTQFGKNMIELKLLMDESL